MGCNKLQTGGVGGNTDILSNDTSRVGRMICLYTQMKNWNIFYSLLVSTFLFVTCYFWIANQEMMSTRIYDPSLSQSISKESKLNITRTISHLTRVDPHDYRYIVFAKDICKSEPVVLLVVVISTAGNFQRKQTIRETWGSDVKNSNLRAKLIFMLGKPLSVAEQMNIISENDVHNDIIQEDFMDTYEKLILKSVAMLKWSSTRCSQAKFLLKADDDIYINLPNVIQDTKSIRNGRFIIGSVLNSTRPILDKKSKWYAPSFNRTFYPTYISGAAYLISGDVVGELYQASLKIPLFWLEDVYITGILAEKIPINLIDNDKYSSLKRAATGCENKKNISSHPYTVGEIRKI